jgi:hypothetical protein
MHKRRRRGVGREDWVGMCWGVVFVCPFSWNEEEEGGEAGEFEEGADPSQTRGARAILWRLPHRVCHSVMYTPRPIPL